MGSMNASTLGSMPNGGGMSQADYIAWLEQQVYSNQASNGQLWANATKPDGTPIPPRAQPTWQGPQPPSIGQQFGQQGSQIAGQYVANQMIPSAPAAASPFVPGATVSSGMPAISSGYPATEAIMSTAPEATMSAVNASPVPAAAAPSWFQAAMPYAAPAAVAAIGAYTGIKANEARENSQFMSQNFMSGVKQGIKDAGPLNFVPLLGQAVWMAGGLGALFGSGKDKDQHYRDKIREELVKTGFLNPDYSFSLPDGSTFDWGKDGNARLPNEGKDPITGQDWRHYYDVDWSRSDAGGLVAAANPLAALFARGDKKLTRDYAGYIVNTAMQSKDPLSAIKAMIEKAGMGHDQIYGAVHLMSKSQGGPLEDSIADAYKNGLDQIYGVGAYEGKGPQLGTPDIQPGQKPQQPSKPTQAGPMSNAPAPQAAATPPQGTAGQAQQPVPQKSPFIGSMFNNARPGAIAAPTRISPGVWQDQRGQYLSKTGARGK